MTDEKALRPLEPGIHVDLEGKLDYHEYLKLDALLSAQVLRSDPPHHDEMLFVIQHQTSELWMKLVIHELSGAIAHLREDRTEPALKMLARIERIQLQLAEQWSVLETLTPSEYLEFRHILGPASGFQSRQYRMIEFLLGNKNAELIEVHRHYPDAYAELMRVLEAPSLYDEFLRWLARRGHAIPAALLERDVRLPHVREPALIPVYKRIYEDTATHWEEYHLCEELVDIESNFQLWRFRHLRTVQRIIGFRPGTGGSSGVAFLARALDQTFFPELFDVRTELSTPSAG
ncbi:MAG: tryptophan 2,3-dioxygenase family protein [Lysobacterales bacterium]